LRSATFLISIGHEEVSVAEAAILVFMVRLSVVIRTTHSVWVG
jgi:hypothetical protein